MARRSLRRYGDRRAWAACATTVTRSTRNASACCATIPRRSTMSQTIKHFLIVFDHERGRLEDLLEFDTNSEKAVAAYSAKEHELQGRKLVEIVLIGSD